MSFSHYAVNAEASAKRSGSNRSRCRKWMQLHSTVHWALRLHSCRALSSQWCRQHKPQESKGPSRRRNSPINRSKKCNLCAREKMLPLHRNIHFGTLTAGFALLRAAQPPVIICEPVNPPGYNGSTAARHKKKPPERAAS